MAAPTWRSALLRTSLPFFSQGGILAFITTHMIKKLTVYQKPTCSKCRSTLKLLRDRGVEFEAIDYYEKPLSVEDLRGLLKKLKLTAIDVLRQDEPIARDLGIGKKQFSEEELLSLMAKHPDLIQRPIVVCGNDAVLGRPPENVETLIS
jgi:arsenate reductase (glutaredoxin)